MLYVVQKMKTIISVLFPIYAAGLLHAEDPYQEYAQDRVLLRSTTEIKSGTKQTEIIKASSAEANQAAYRLFSNVSMLFKTRSEVLAILGDPASISGYGVKAKQEKDADLVYRFDSGLGGWQYTIKFRNDRVWVVQADSLD